MSTAMIEALGSEDIKRTQGTTYEPNKITPAPRPRIGQHTEPNRALQAKALEYQHAAGESKQEDIHTTSFRSDQMQAEALHPTLFLTEQQLGDVASKADLPQMIFPAPSTPMPNAAGVTQVLDVMINTWGFTDDNGTPITAEQLAMASVEHKETEASKATPRFATPGVMRARSQAFGLPPPGLRPPEDLGPPKDAFTNVKTIISNPLLEQAMERAMTDSLIAQLKDPQRFVALESEILWALREHHTLAVANRRLGITMQTLEQNIFSTYIKYREVRVALERAYVHAGSGSDVTDFIMPLMERRRKKPQAVMKKVKEQLIRSEEPQAGAHIRRDGGVPPDGRLRAGAGPHGGSSPFGGAHNPDPTHAGDGNPPDGTNFAESGAPNVVPTKGRAGGRPAGSLSSKPLRNYRVADDAANEAKRNAAGLEHARSAQMLVGRMAALLKQLIDVQYKALG